MKKTATGNVKRSAADLIKSFEQFYKSDTADEKGVLSLSDDELFTILLGE